MTERDQDPGAPGNDVMAAERARTAMVALEGDPEIRMRGIAAAFVGEHTFTWERDVNSAGVPVRRYVAWSQWEVDPEPPMGPRGHYTIRYVLRSVPTGGDPGERP